MEKRLKFGDYVKINDPNGFFKDVVGRVVDLVQDLNYGNPPQGQQWVGIGQTSMTISFEYQYIVKLEKDGLVHNKQISGEMLEKINPIEYMKERKRDQG